MNTQQKKWFDYYIESGDDKRAVEIAYPDVSEVNQSSKAGHLRQRFALEIDKASREQYGQFAPLMMKVIKDIALDCKQPAVRLKAADTWLSRAGHDAALIVETKASATHEELINRLKIAATGIDPDLLRSVLGEPLTDLMGGTQNEQGQERTIN